MLTFSESGPAHVFDTADAIVVASNVRTVDVRFTTTWLAEMAYEPVS
jgi:hypothetical protein